MDFRLKGLMLVHLDAIPLNLSRLPALKGGHGMCCGCFYEGNPVGSSMEIKLLQIQMQEREVFHHVNKYISREIAISRLKKIIIMKQLVFLIVFLIFLFSCENKQSKIKNSDSYANRDSLINKQTKLKSGIIYLDEDAFGKIIEPYRIFKKNKYKY